LEPSSTILQLNGNACASPDGYESCAAREHFLALSSCVNTCPGSALPLKTPEGAYKCISGDGEYTPPNITDVANEVFEPTGNKQPTSSASLPGKNGNVIFIIMGLLVARFAKK
jgi:hypothetical protein